MAEFKAIGLIDVGEIGTDHGGNREKQITLVDKLDWFLTQEFKDLKSECTKKPPCVLVNQNNDTHIPVFSSTGNLEYDYTCYECVRVNHGSPVFQTNSQSDYQKHWLSHNIKSTCYPNKADLELHRWTPQGREWEK